MATRTLPFTDWLRLVRKHALGDEFENLAGYPSMEAARRLDVSKQRVSQLVSEGVLDVLELTTRGKVTMTLITEASLNRYLAKRVPDRNRQGYFAFPA